MKITPPPTAFNDSNRVFNPSIPVDSNDDPEVHFIVLLEGSIPSSIRNSA